MRYRYNISGYVEVEADSPEQANQKVTVKLKNGETVQQSFTDYHERDKTFVYAVAIGQPEQQRD